MIREVQPDGTVTYRETPAEWADELLIQIACRMDQLINEIMIVCPRHRVSYWEREQQEISRILRGYLDAKIGETMGKIAAEPKGAGKMEPDAK